MPDGTSKRIEFEPFKRRRVEARFDGGSVSSDGGVLLLRKLERRLGLLDAVARARADPRDPERIEHELGDMLKERMFGLVQGYEDLNDHTTLRTDPLMQTACERDVALASAPRFDLGSPLLPRRLPVKPGIRYTRSTTAFRGRDVAGASTLARSPPGPTWSDTMFAAYRDLEGYADLLAHVVRRASVLKFPPVKDELLRQIYFTGPNATAGVVIRGAAIGALIIAYVLEVLEADAALAVKILLWVVLREVGPLIAAVLVIQRSGAAVASELAAMSISGEILSLRQMRISPYDYLVVPRVVAIALSIAALTIYVQIISVGGGMLLGSLVTEASLSEMFHLFVALAHPVDLLYSIVKSLVSGIAIGVIACHHGLRPPDRSINGIPKAVIRASTQATLAVMLLNAVFAYLVFGVLFFGLIKAQV